MRDRDLYATILGVSSPWRVRSVELSEVDAEVLVMIEQEVGTSNACPECGADCPGYDTRKRRWRHLDTCQFRTILEVAVPRVKCPEHGVRQVVVPWAEPGSRFTALFEALVIDWLKEASIRAVARLIGLTWDEVDGIMSRAVRRGLRRREDKPLRHVGVDETSFQKRHEYVTVVIDQEESTVVHVADGRREEVLYDFYGNLKLEHLAGIETVAMDMWGPYIAATRKALPSPEEKIVFDKFHVAKHLGDAVDKVRRQEHRALTESGDDTLKGSKYSWLMSRGRMTEEQRSRLDNLRRCVLKTARAWAIKELAMSLWSYQTRGWARRAWNGWLAWAMRCRLEPVKRVARMVKKHLEGIINAVVLKITTARSEGINSRIQWLKKRACGFRNRERFRNAIYFHLGGLDLYPKLAPASAATHTRS